MHNAKAINIIKTFTSDELARFPSFIQASSSVPMRSHVVALAHVIREYAPDFEGEWLKAENLYKKAFPDTAYNSSGFSKAMSYLYAMSLKFLGFLESEREEATNYALSGFQLQSRGFEDLAEQARKKAEKTAEAAQFRDGEYFRAQHLIALLASILRRGDLSDIESDHAVQTALDVAYLRDKFHYASLAWSQGRLVAGVPDTPFLEEIILGLAKHRSYLGKPTLALYYYGYMMNADDANADAHFDRFNALLESHAHRLPVPYRMALNSKATNFCLQKYIAGESGYALKAFALDERAERKGELVAKGVLPERKFKSIVSLAVEVKKTEWVTRFIEKYASQIKEEIRSQTVDLALAEVEVASGDFSAAKKRLLCFKKADDFDYLKVQTLYMKMDFEERNWEEVERYSKNVRQYFQRNDTLAEEFKDKSRQIFLFAERVSRVFLSEKRQQRMLLEEIEADVKAEYFTGRMWLWEQIETFIQEAIEDEEIEVSKVER